MTGRWYRPGGSVALMSDGVAVLTHPEHEAALVELFEQLGERTVEVPDVVDALGEGEQLDAACVVVEGEHVRILVRGRFGVLVDGQVVVADEPDSADPTAWTGRSAKVAIVDEAVLLSVEAEQVAEGQTGEGPEPAVLRRLPLAAGIVAAAEARWLAVPAAAALPGPATSAPVAAPAAHEAEQPPAAPPVEDTPAPATAPTPAPAPAAAAAPPVPDSPATMLDVDEHEFDAMFGMTVPGRRPEDAAIRTAESDPAESDPDDAGSTPGDHDGHTVARSSLPRAGRRAADTSEPAASGPVAVLSVSNGDTYDITGRALVGRSPRSTAATGRSLPQLVVLDDPYVSGTHLEIEVGPTTVLVTDVSTNGTTVTPAGGAEGVLVKHEPTPVGDGSVLRLSETLTITVAVKDG